MRPTEALLQQFNSNDLSYFVMVDAKNFVVSSNIKTNDISKAAEKLMSFVRTLPATSFANYKVYCFEEMPETKGVDSKAIASILHLADITLSYCPFYETDERKEEKEANRFFYNQRQEQLAAELAEIKASIAALRDVETDEELEEQAEPNNVLAGLINNPQIQNMLIGAIQGLVGKYMLGASQPQAMAGIPQDQDSEEKKLVNAIDRLYKADPLLPDDLLKLADLAETNKGQFEFLISMLRK